MDVEENWAGELHKLSKTGSIQCLKCVTQVQQRPESPTVTHLACVYVYVPCIYTHAR